MSDPAVSDPADPASPPRSARRMLPRLGRLAAGMLDLVLPPLCLACELPVASHGGVCAECWGGLRLIERPFCDRLCLPFAYDLGEGALSPQAIAEPPPFGRLRAVAVHDGVARRLVHGLKYRDQVELSRIMAGWMARAAADIAAEAALVVPVPLHRKRLWDRRFNQAALLAQEFGRRTGRTVAPMALERVRATRQQVGLSANERDRNVRGAFQVRAAARSAVAGRRVLLVDDVYTTGATVAAATRALRRGGAEAVDVAVFSRVVRD